MDSFNGQERRKYIRIPASYIVDYYAQNPNQAYNVTHAKNVSLGGIAITTDKYFAKGTQLMLAIRFPFISQQVKVTVEVVDCKEKKKDMLYEVRSKFIDLNPAYFDKIKWFVDKSNAAENNT